MPVDKDRAVDDVGLHKDVVSVLFDGFSTFGTEKFTLSR